MGAGAVASTIVGAFLVSNPVGWGILAVTAVGIGASSFADYLYKNNKYGVKKQNR